MCIVDEQRRWRGRTEANSRIAKLGRAVLSEGGPGDDDGSEVALLLEVRVRSVSCFRHPQDLYLYTPPCVLFLLYFFFNIPFCIYTTSPTRNDVV